jgi:PAS domain S-box-containing protein
MFGWALVHKEAEIKRLLKAMDLKTNPVARSIAGVTQTVQNLAGVTQTVHTSLKKNLLAILARTSLIKSGRSGSKKDDDYSLNSSEVGHSRNTSESSTHTDNEMLSPTDKFVDDTSFDAIADIRNTSESSTHTDNEMLSPTNNFVEKALEVDNVSRLSKSSNDVLLVDEASFDAIIVTDCHGVIQQANQTAVDEFGFESKEELLGKNISMLDGGDDAAKHDGYLERFQKAGQSSSTIGKQYVLQSRRKDGTEFPCIVGIKKIPDSEVLVGYIRNMADISQEEKTAEVKAITLLSQTEETSFHAIIITDYHGVIKQINQTVLSEFGYATKEDIVSKNISMLVGGGKAKKDNTYLMGKSGFTIGKQRVLYARRKDGSEFQCLIGIKEIPNTESLIGYIRNMSSMNQSTAEDDVHSAE